MSASNITLTIVFGVMLVVLGMIVRTFQDSDQLPLGEMYRRQRGPKARSNVGSAITNFIYFILGALISLYADEIRNLLGLG